MKIKGNIGIGTTSPTKKLDVAGDVIANNYYQHSDARLKKNITPIDNALAKVAALHGDFKKGTQPGPRSPWGYPPARVMHPWGTANTYVAAGGVAAEPGFRTCPVKQAPPDIAARDQHTPS